VARGATVARSLWEALGETAERFPERDAIVCGDERLTFGAWRERAVGYAATLLESGLARGERVLLWQEPSPQLAASLFGVWAAAGIPVLLDPKGRGPQLSHALRTTEASCIVTSGDTALPLDDPSVAVIDAAEVGAAGSPRDLPEPPDPGEPASILFTSGSTGRPKGVTQSHDHLLRGARTVSGYLGITSRDGILCSVPWSFDYGFVQLQTTAVTGATQILPVPMNPAGICAALERHRPTVLPGIPSLFEYLLSEMSTFRDSDRSSLRVVTNTGARLRPHLLHELLRLLPEARFFLNYGLTESYRTSYLDPSLVRERPDSVGRGIPGVELAIVRDDGSPAEPGEIGEIVHRGDFVFLGYWNDPEATVHSRRPDPSGSGRPALFTGDYGWLDAEGFLYFHGRRDRQIKVMGVRVALDEIEQILCESGLLKEVAVFSVRHDLLGHEIHTAFVGAEAGDLRRELSRFARQNMTPNMIPRRYLPMQKLPKTSSQKTDYEALKRRAVIERHG